MGDLVYIMSRSERERKKLPSPQPSPEAGTIQLEAVFSLVPRYQAAENSTALQLSGGSILFSFSMTWTHQLRS
jgi:hypothetical protein